MSVHLWAATQTAAAPPSSTILHLKVNKGNNYMKHKRVTMGVVCMRGCDEQRA